MNFKSNSMPIWVCLLILITSVGYPVRLDAGIIHQEDFNASDFDIWSITAPNGNSFSKVSGRDMFGSGEIGQPELPYKVIRFLVPDNAYDFNVTIEDIGAASPFVLDNAIYPVQEDVSINDYSDDMFTFPDKEMYRSLKTSFKAEILDESRLEGRYHIIAVGLWPLAYSGKEKELEMCGSMRISLEYKENTFFKQKSSTQNSESFINISDIVVNADQIQNASVSPLDLEIGGSILLQKLPRYYIISERSLIPALEDLATWKRQKGYSVITKAIEDIYEDSKYKVGSNGIVDEAASLRKYLQDEYAAQGTFFCFLVGDHRTRMPIRKAVTFNAGSVIKNNPNGDNYIPTDNYFSDLSKNGWSLFKEANNLYVSTYLSTYDPYIYVGRLLCHSKEEVSNYTKKLILYESNPGRGNANYLTDTMIFVQYDGKNYYKNTLKEMSGIFNSVVSFLDSKIANTAANSYPTGEVIINQMNVSGYNSLMGHGEPGTIACSGINEPDWEYIKALNTYKYDQDSTKSQTNLSKLCYNNGLDLMNNYDCPSVVYTMSCTTMPFDVYAGWRDVFDLPHTMASSYTVGGVYGGVAYVGNTRSGYWKHSPDLEVLFLRQLPKNPKIGIAEAISKSIFDVEYNSNRRFVRHTHNLIGDPEFEMWIRQPSNLNVHVSWDRLNITVGGSDAVGSTVVINNGEGGIRHYNVNESKAPVMYVDGGKMEAVGVYKSGFLPIVKLDCYNDELKNCNKKFVVRDAQLGYAESTSVVIGQDADIDVRAVDSINVGSGLNILSKGKLSLRCDKDVSLDGAEVATGGRLTVKGEKVTLSNGFSVKAGAALSITTN